MQTILLIGQHLYDLGGLPLVQLAIYSPFLIGSAGLWLATRYCR